MKPAMRLVAAMILCTGATASADKGKAPPRHAGHGKHAPAPAMQALGWLAGTWTCTGTVKIAGTQQAVSGKMTSKWELENHFLSSTFEEGKSKDNPTPHRSLGLIGWDATAGVFKSTMGDNLGTLQVLTSKGWDKDTWTWTGNVKFMDMDATVTDAYTKGKTDREVKRSGSIGPADKGVVWAMTCTK